MLFYIHTVSSCRKTARVIITANQKKGKYPREPMRIQSNTSKLPKAWENSGDEVVIGFSFASD